MITQKPNFVKPSFSTSGILKGMKKITLSLVILFFVTLALIFPQKSFAVFPACTPDTQGKLIGAFALENLCPSQTFCVVNTGGGPTPFECYDKRVGPPPSPTPPPDTNRLAKIGLSPATPKENEQVNFTVNGHGEDTLIFYTGPKGAVSDQSFWKVQFEVKQGKCQILSRSFKYNNVTCSADSTNTWVLNVASSPFGKGSFQAKVLDTKGFLDSLEFSTSGTIDFNYHFSAINLCDDKTTIGIQTAIGCIPTGKLPDFLSFVLRWVFGISGGIILMMLIFTGYGLLTSTGNPEKLQAVKENIVSLFSGLVLIVFSLVLLQTIGVNILQLPGF